MNRSFPNTRLRRLRQKSFVRNLISETQVSANDLIWPVFILDGKGQRQKVESLPGVERLSVDELIKDLKPLIEKGLQAIALFPVIDENLKSELATEAYNPKGLVPKALQQLKDTYPDLGLITDVALDPYTSHGQDGLLGADGQILNDETNDVLVKQALCHAAAGADMVAPSDMMDGRIGMIRKAFEDNKFKNTLILSYAAKYASCFYGPFRDAVGSAKNLGASSKETYQMNPANADVALHEVELDLNEGADIVMVKPGLPYLDIVKLVKDNFKVPTFAYHVSGEYAMVKAASEKGWVDEKKIVMESLISFKRAGCDAILTYFAKDVLLKFDNSGIR